MRNGNMSAAGRVLIALTALTAWAIWTNSFTRR